MHETDYHKFITYRILETYNQNLIFDILFNLRIEISNSFLSYIYIYNIIIIVKNNLLQIALR